MRVGGFLRTAQTLLDYIRRFKKTLSPRDVLLLQIGMRASHIEEALAVGDVDRAKAHLVQLAEQVRRL